MSGLPPAYITRMRYSLLSLHLALGAGPPAIAVLWFGWRPILVLVIVAAAMWLWVAGTLALARFLARDLLLGDALKRSLARSGLFLTSRFFRRFLGGSLGRGSLRRAASAAGLGAGAARGAFG